MDTAVGITTGERFHFIGAHEVEVAGHGVLERRSRNGKFKSISLIIHCEKAVDKAAREGVAAADAVDDGIDVVALGFVEFITIENPSIRCVWPRKIRGGLIQHT